MGPLQGWPASVERRQDIIPSSQPRVGGGFPPGVGLDDKLCTTSLADGRCAGTIPQHLSIRSHMASSNPRAVYNSGDGRGGRLPFTTAEMTRYAGVSS